MRMKIRAYLMIGCIVCFETHASQHSDNGSTSDSTATHFPTKKPFATMAGHSNHDSISQPGPVKAGAAPTVLPTQTPVPTAGIIPSSTIYQSTEAQFHTGTFLGGMMLAFIITLAGCVCYRLACSRHLGHYRPIEEHDAII